ncbi:MAG TPA: YceI family protein [bacterium]|nr:YceI family protein [bacterium]
MFAFRSPMVGIAAAVLLLPGLASADTQTFDVDPVHSQVGFKVRHLVARVPGHFGDFNGTISLDPDDVAGTLSVEATVQTASVDTGNDDRDKHLRSEDFFHAEEHPEITFVSKSVEDQGDNVYTVTGDLSMRGVTKSVTLQAEYFGTEKNPFTGTPTAGMDLTGKVNRQDFGIQWNKTLDSGGLILGDTVLIEVHVEATVPPAEQS